MRHLFVWGPHIKVEIDDPKPAPMRGFVTAFFTQRLEFKSGNCLLRPGTLLTLRIECTDYSLGIRASEGEGDGRLSPDQPPAPGVYPRVLSQIFRTLLHRQRQLNHTLQRALQYLSHNAQRAHAKRDRKSGRLKLGLEQVYATP